jgi:hypothetical protein
MLTIQYCLVEMFWYRNSTSSLQIESRGTKGETLSQERMAVNIVLPTGTVCRAGTGMMWRLASFGSVVRVSNVCPSFARLHSIQDETHACTRTKYEDHLAQLARYFS